MRRTSVTLVEMIFVHAKALPVWQFYLNGGKTKDCSLFSSTETRRRDKLVNFQVGNSIVQDENETNNNASATITERII